MLTDLEGAILIEIGFRQRTTAFKVRQAFKCSPSSDWQGSAGSVYPAIRRLVEKGLVLADAAHDARGTQRLSLSTSGRNSLREWSLDGAAALGIGMDPFRLRAGLWRDLPADQQLNLARQMISGVESSIAALREYSRDQDPFEAAQVELASELQELRLSWLCRWRERLMNPAE